MADAACNWRRSCSCNCNISMMTASSSASQSSCIFQVCSHQVNHHGNPTRRHTPDPFSGTEWDSHESIPLQLVCFKNSGGRATIAEKVAGAGELAQIPTIGCSLVSLAFNCGQPSCPVNLVAFFRSELGTALGPCITNQNPSPRQKSSSASLTHPSTQPQKPGSFGRPSEDTLTALALVRQQKQGFELNPSSTTR